MVSNLDLTDLAPEAAPIKQADRQAIDGEPFGRRRERFILLQHRAVPFLGVSAKQLL